LPAADNDVSDHDIGLVDLRAGYLAYSHEIDEAVHHVLDGGWYVLGRHVAEFEEAFASWCGTGYCVGVGNGTDAIAIALRALGIGSGDAVFTVSHTAVATVAAIEMAGAKPVLVDIESKSYTLNPARLEEAVAQYAHSGAAGKPKAVVAVHLYGHPCDVVAIRAVCDRHGLRLIEDCAQAHGATIGGKRVGIFGDTACFSFYPTKNLPAFGDGGAIVTADVDLASRCRALRQYGWFRHYESDIAGVNSRLDDLQAAILSVRLRHLDDEMQARRNLATRYDAGLRGVVGVPKVRVQTEHAYHLYVVRSDGRDSLRVALKEQAIASAIHYPFAVHEQEAYAGRIAIGPGGLEQTERACREILSLPMHPFMPRADADRVIAAVQAAVKGKE
jgi:dTDP-4-amino-4,6-dideoxygalactose transaminase